MDGINMPKMAFDLLPCEILYMIEDYLSIVEKLHFRAALNRNTKYDIIKAFGHVSFITGFKIVLNDLKHAHKSSYIKIHHDKTYYRKSVGFCINYKYYIINISYFEGRFHIHNSRLTSVCSNTDYNIENNNKGVMCTSMGFFFYDKFHIWIEPNGTMIYISFMFKGGYHKIGINTSDSTGDKYIFGMFGANVDRVECSNYIKRDKKQKNKRFLRQLKPLCNMIIEVGERMLDESRRAHEWWNYHTKRSIHPSSSFRSYADRHDILMNSFKYLQKIILKDKNLQKLTICTPLTINIMPHIDTISQWDRYFNTDDNL